MRLMRSKLPLGGGWEAESIGKPLVPAVVVGDLAIPKHIHVHHPGADGQPAITLQLEVGDDGSAVCQSLHLERVEGGREIRPIDLDVIRRGVYTWIPSVVAAFAWRVERTGKETYAVQDWGPTDETYRQAVEISRARRPRKLTSDFLKRVAGVYRENFATKPTEAVAEVFGVAHRTAASYVQAAREAGHLSKTDPGRKKI